MKKWIAILLAAVMCFSLAACSGAGGKTEVIELTLDNWKDYFELAVTEYYDINGFGEVERLEIQQDLVVKQEYAEDVVCDNVVFELNPTAQRIQVTLNAVDQTYTLGEVIDEVAVWSSPKVIELFSYESKGSTKLHGYGYLISSDYIKAENGEEFVDLVETLEDLEVTRVQGTITIKH